MKKLLCIMMLALPLAAGAEVIWQSDAGTYCAGDGKYGGCTAVSLRVEIGVWPVAWGHSVGAVYTQDGWLSFDVSNAEWEANVDNPFGGQDEQWAANIYVGYTSMGGELRDTEYALFVVNGNGDTSWDNNNGWNYYFGN